MVSEAHKCKVEGIYMVSEAHKCKVEGIYMVSEAHKYAPVSQIYFYFGITHYMFWTVLLSIFRSTRLYIQ